MKNNWVGYIDRTYEQIKAAILQKLQAQLPEITDHNESNPWVKGVAIWAGITEMLGYTIDSKAREAYLSTCRKFASAVKIAAMFDYRVRGRLAASVDLRFYLAVAAPSDITIPAETIVSTPDGIRFMTTEIGVILTGETQVTIPAKQWEKGSMVLGDSDGLARQVFEIEEAVVDDNISVTVGVANYLPVQTFAFSTPTDQVFVNSINVDNVMQVAFGDGINGDIPNTANQVSVDYYTTTGSGGNVALGTINNVVSQVPLPGGVILKVTNDLAASGGRDSENLSDLKRNIPLSLRTLDRAVTRQDYIDVASLAPGVAKAGVEYSADNKVKVYIAPQGGGIASSSLLSATLEYLEERKMITTPVEVYTAGEVTVELLIDLYVLKTNFRSVVKSDVITALTDFLSVENQNIGGRVELGDIYQVIENREGVDYGRIIKMSPKPYARPQTAKLLNWSVEILEGSLDAVFWRVTMISTTRFNLIRGENYVGSFDVDQLVSYPEFQFTIHDDNYELGDSWTFYTYPYFGGFRLLEQSIPATYPANITIRAYGGIA